MTDGRAALTGSETPASTEDYTTLGDTVDGTHEPLSARERWEAFDTVLWASVLAPRRQRANESLQTCEAAIREGRRPTREEDHRGRQLA